MKGRGRRWSPGNNGVRRVQWRESSTIKTCYRLYGGLTRPLSPRRGGGGERVCVCVCVEEGRGNSETEFGGQRED